MKRMTGAFLAFAGLVSFVGCGSGNEPLSVLGDPAVSEAGTLSLPYGTLNGAAVPLSSYTPFVTSLAANDGFDFNSSTSGTVPILAPATGLVTAVDSSSLTIVHNVHVASRLSRMNSVTVRVGDYVAAGAALGSTTVGTGSNQNIVHFSVLVDGVATCPYTYLTDDTKTVLISVISSTTRGPCYK